MILDYLCVVKNMPNMKFKQLNETVKLHFPCLLFVLQSWIVLLNHRESDEDFVEYRPGSMYI